MGEELLIERILQESMFNNIVYRVVSEYGHKYRKDNLPIEVILKDNFLEFIEILLTNLVNQNEELQQHLIEERSLDTRPVKMLFNN